MGLIFVSLGKRMAYCVCLLQLGMCLAYAQTPAPARCQVLTSPVPVRAEGLAERLGDITLRCTGSVPGTVFSGNFSLAFPVSVTNRVDANNLTHDAVVYVDLGSGEVPTGIAGRVSGNRISFDGISYTTPPSGNINLRISGIRAAMNQQGITSAVPAAVTASLTTPLTLDQSQVVVAYAQAGVFSSMSSTGISCYGSPAPDTFDLPSLFAAGTAFASTRVTEGFATAFDVRSAGADAGTRFLVKYSGFPATAHVYIPDAVAGSGALTPTSGGDMSLPQAVGRYQPGSGALLLVRVPDADGTGAGGTPVNAPVGLSPVTLDSVSEVTLTNGAGYAVYEVVSANGNMRESAQFPTFVSLPRLTPYAIAQETIALAPVSTVATASAAAPIPRFAAVTPQSDCQLFGDCGVPVVASPKLFVEAMPIHLTAVAAGGAMTSAPGTFTVHNYGSGAMPWSLSAIYQGGTGWLTFDPQGGTNDATVKVTANTTTLTEGVWLATVLVNAGAAGSNSIFVFLTVSAPPTPPPPAAPSVVVSQVLNAATLEVAPLVAGSLATLKGSHLSGANVAVTFDGIPATLIYTSDTQINLQVPPALGSRTSASLVVTVDGASSTPRAVPLTVAWPAVFAHGVLNQNGGENTTLAGAAAGEILQIFATGIPKLATVSVQIGYVKDLVPVYAGDAPGCPGVQQVNVAVPDGVTGIRNAMICATVGGQQYCSSAFSITVR
jgi:uncharacterized protein (TIGR03437 family)